MRGTAGGATRSSKPGPMTPAQRWVIALTSVGSFMVVLDLLVVATALTSIRRGLHASIEDLEWTVNAYTLSFAAYSTMRQLGGAFGVAILAAVFGAAGSYASGATFSQGFAPAIGVAAALALAGALAGLALPGLRPAGRPPSAPPVPAAAAADPVP